MDPITINRLGQIRQQEIVEMCLRDAQDFGTKRGVAVLMQRLCERLSAAVRGERPQAAQQAGRKVALSR